MRVAILSLVAVFVLFLAGESVAPLTAASTTTISGASAASAVQQPDFQVDVDIDRDGGAWYANPMWIAIGVIAVVLLIALIVMAARGGGTTIVKD